MWLYFSLLLGSIAVPLSLSFDRRLQFYKRWKFVLPSLIMVALVYILFDRIFTQKGVWGFNPDYISGIHLFGLPMEEVLFFVVIPYASIFLHDAFHEYFPQIRTGKKITLLITAALIVLSILIILFNPDKTYTLYIFSKVLVVLVFSLFDKTRTISVFYITFLIILIPFVIVNGILTGTGIDSEVVWYNNDENLGIRFLTIPIEDFGYGFSMILFNLLFISQLKTINRESVKEKFLTLHNAIRNNPKFVILFFIIFYGVGIIGMTVPFSFPFFQRLIPLALLLTAAGLLIFHEKFESKTYIIYVTVFATSLIFEIIGVTTGVIFGLYYYGESLGLKLMNTPVIIGLNWLLMVYITASLTRRWNLPAILQVPVAAFLMVGYDLVLEQVAPKLDMWYWVNHEVPLRNYIAWFILSLFFHILFRIFNLKTSNKLAFFMFLCQILFFLILLIIFKFLP